MGPFRCCRKVSAAMRRFNYKKNFTITRRIAMDVCTTYESKRETPMQLRECISLWEWNRTVFIFLWSETLQPSSTYSKGTPHRENLEWFTLLCKGLVIYNCARMPSSLTSHCLESTAVLHIAFLRLKTFLVIWPHFNYSVNYEQSIRK